MFLILFGLSSLDLNGYRLFSHGDPGMHYIGWRFFREAPWQIMPGLMNDLDYPYSVSVIFTDSIPLMAVFFKIFRDILPVSFNYLGLWTVLCFVLQGVFSFKILDLYVRNRLLKYTGGCFFVMTPALIKRTFWHTALTSHFLILAALYLFLNDKEKRVGHEVLCWGLLGFLCGSIHLYFLGFCGMIAVFAAVDRMRRGSFHVWKALLLPLVFALTGFITVWILGGLDSGMFSGAPGFGYYSFNLNGFFNGDSWSRFLNFPYYEGAQTEGFAYLGIGILVMSLISCVFVLDRRFFGGKNDAGIPAENAESLENSCFPVCVVLFFTALAFAVSTEVTFFDKLLFSFDISDAGQLKKLFDIFRSSGRFAWIPMYLIMTGCFITFDRIYGKCFKNRGKRSRAVWTCIILLMLFIQIFDLYPGLSKRSADVKGTEEYEEMLLDDYWKELAESGKYKHIYFMDKENLTQEELYAVAFFAVENGMTINDFNFARGFDLHSEEIAADSAKRHPGDSIYIFSEESWDRAYLYPELEIRIADMLMIGV